MGVKDKEGRNVCRYEAKGLEKESFSSQREGLEVDKEGIREDEEDGGDKDLVPVVGKKDIRGRSLKGLSVD